MPTEYTRDKTDSRKIRTSIDRLNSDATFTAHMAKQLNDHKSQAHQRIEDAKRKIAEKRERKQQQNQNT